MIQQFKPGDYAGKCAKVVSVEQREGFQWLMLEGRNEYVTSTAFVRVVPVSKIREVCERTRDTATRIGSLWIDHLFEELTGEPLRKEST